MSLLAIKRRRLYGKQPASQLDDVGPCEDGRLAVVTLPEEEEPAPRFDFLSQKTINTLVRAVLEKKTEQELHSLTVATIDDKNRICPLSIWRWTDGVGPPPGMQDRILQGGPTTDRRLLLLANSWLYDLLSAYPP